MTAPEKSESGNNGNNNGKRNRTLWILFAVFGTLGILFLLYWLIVLRFEETTEDAYVQGNLIVVTSRIPGSPIAYFADDTDLVEEGQVLVKLDPTDYFIEFERQKANLALAARQVREAIENKEQMKANVVLLQAQLTRAKIDFQNRQGLVDTRAVSKEDFDHSKTAYEGALASLQVAIHEYDAAVASVGSTPPEEHPTIQVAKANLQIAYINWQRCTILAPATGFVAKRAVQVGTTIKTDTSLMSIIPLENIWIEANFLETELENMRIGQPVTAKTDLYGRDVIFKGTVGGVGAGTGSVFSLLPPQNATGNWIKIAQRVPVRIYLDKEQIRQYPLRIGLSATVRVDTHDLSGKVLAATPSIQKLASTTVFDIPMEEINALIDAIIKVNLNYGT